jgi:hypothetical protein
MKQVNLQDPLLWLVFLAILAAVAGCVTTASWFLAWFTAGVTFAFGFW